MVDMWNVVIGRWVGGHRLAWVQDDKDEGILQHGVGVPLWGLKDSRRSKLES